jgi:hypothetical protein
MKIDATLEDYQNREKFLIKYIESQIKKKTEKQIENYDSEGHGKRSAYKDILFKLTKE